MGSWHVRPFTIVVAVLAASLWFSHAHAARPKRPHHLPVLRGYSSIVIDAATGAVLSQSNADAVRYPASLTKMMTLYLVFGALHSGKWTLDTKLPVSVHASEQSPTKLGLRPGQQISVKDVILGIVTRSANDAAVVAAEGLGGTEGNFAQLMTAQARRLGMTNTHFDNASGLPDPLNTTTARDLAHLSQALVRDYPQYYRYFSTPEFTFNGQKIMNHDHLISWYQGADGIKTGFINAAGFNLATSAVRDGRRLIGIVLGGPSPYARDHYMAKLLDAAFAGTAPAPALPDLREASAVVTAPVQTAPDARAARIAQARAKKTKRRHVGALDVAETTASHRVERDEQHGWAIQVGAFNRIAGARKAAEAAAELAPMQLTDAGIEISSMRNHKRSAVHRARLMGLTAAQAHEACHILVEKDRDCLVLSPVDLHGVATRLAIN
jgi:D-alanyl-D-alanine carboxypeptidase